MEEGEEEAGTGLQDWWTQGESQDVDGRLVLLDCEHSWRRLHWIRQGSNDSFLALEMEVWVVVERMSPQKYHRPGSDLPSSQTSQWPEIVELHPCQTGPQVPGVRTVFVSCWHFYSSSASLHPCQPPSDQIPDWPEVRDNQEPSTDGH